MTHQQKSEQEVKAYKAFLDEKDQKVAELAKITERAKNINMDNTKDILKTILISFLIVAGIGAALMMWVYILHMAVKLSHPCQ